MLPSLTIPILELSSVKYSITNLFNVYTLVSCLKVYGRRPFKENNTFILFLSKNYNILISIVYTWKYLILLETPAAKSHEEIYFPEIQELSYHLTFIQVSGTYQCYK